MEAVRMSSGKGTLVYVPEEGESLEAIAFNAAACAAHLDGMPVCVTYGSQSFETYGDEAALLQQLRGVQPAAAPPVTPPYEMGCGR